MALYGLNARGADLHPGHRAGHAGQAALTPVLDTGCLYEILDCVRAPDRRGTAARRRTAPAGDQQAGRLRQPGAVGAQRTDADRAGHRGRGRAVRHHRRAAADQLRAYNQPVEFVPVRGATHDGAVFATVDQVANWIAARFA